MVIMIKNLSVTFFVGVLPIISLPQLCGYVAALISKDQNNSRLYQMTKKVAVATYRGVEKLILKRKITKATLFKPKSLR